MVALAVLATAACSEVDTHTDDSMEPLGTEPVATDEASEEEEQQQGQGGSSSEESGIDSFGEPEADACLEEHQCGGDCCEGEEICLFDGCIVPGETCITQDDCGSDHYCELSLGDEPAVSDDDECSEPVDQGRCIPLPAVCTGDASDPEDCVEACEYRPPVGELNATVKWSWGYEEAPKEFSDRPDVWSTPVVARIVDSNCDGKIDSGDSPNVAFVSANNKGTQCGRSKTCRLGVLRVISGTTGEEVWSLDKPNASSVGFAGTSLAVGDVDQDKSVDVVALSGEGYPVVLNARGEVTHELPAHPVQTATHGGFGWGGGIALGDMDGDGWPEIAHGRTVYTMKDGVLALLFHGNAGMGGDKNQELSYFVDLDGDGTLELLAGNVAYRFPDGERLWDTSYGDGFTATADLDGDNKPEIALVRNGRLHILEGATGVRELPPVTIPGGGDGGPPTIADFDGDGRAEIGIASKSFYSMFKPQYDENKIDVVWSAHNHDESSSRTGSSVFDFEGDGKAEVVYNDECWLWVYDGATGEVRFAAPTQSFTGTEASVVADVDGNGHADILVVHNGANANHWSCAEHVVPSDKYPVPWSRPAPGADWRGITAYTDAAESWVGTRTLWNQHAYSVTNICDPHDGACEPGSYYGQIPPKQKRNSDEAWLNNFRQNVQDAGIFNAPDPVVSLKAACALPVALTATVRNLGLSALPAGVEVALYRVDKAGDVLLGTVETSKGLFPGQAEALSFAANTGEAMPGDSFRAAIVVDPVSPTFSECRPDNNVSDVVEADCPK